LRKTFAKTAKDKEDSCDPRENHYCSSCSCTLSSIYIALTSTSSQFSLSPIPWLPATPDDTMANTKEIRNQNQHSTNATRQQQHEQKLMPAVMVVADSSKPNTTKFTTPSYQSSTDNIVKL